MTANPAAYFLSAIPPVTRLVLCLRWRKRMAVQLPEEAQERDLQRTFSVASAVLTLKEL